MSLQQRVRRLGDTRAISMDEDGVNTILTQEDWVSILSAANQEAELLRRCPNYYALVAALKAQRPDSRGVRRLRV